MTYYLISASSNDAALGVFLFSSVGGAVTAGEALGYIPAFRSTDPYLIVGSDSRLGKALENFFVETPPVVDEYYGDESLPKVGEEDMEASAGDDDDHYGDDEGDDEGDDDEEGPNWSDNCIEPEDFKSNPELTAALIEACAAPDAVGNMADRVAAFGDCPGAN